MPHSNVSSLRSGQTYAPGFGLEVVEVPHSDGITDPAALAAAGDVPDAPGVPPVAAAGRAEER